MQCIDSLSDADAKRLRSITRDLYAPEEECIPQSHLGSTHPDHNTQWRWMW